MISENEFAWVDVNICISVMLLVACFVIAIINFFDDK
jgi:hypothetical protein